MVNGRASPGAPQMRSLSTSLMPIHHWIRINPHIPCKRICKGG